MLTLVYIRSLFKGLSAQREGRDAMFQQCYAIRQQFKQCLNIRPDLAQIVLHDPNVQNIQKELKDALDDIEKRSSKERRQ